MINSFDNDVRRIYDYLNVTLRSIKACSVSFYKFESFLKLLKTHFSFI